jgi:hypothetical protein
MRTLIQYKVRWALVEQKHKSTEVHAQFLTILRTFSKLNDKLRFKFLYFNSHKIMKVLKDKKKKQLYNLFCLIFSLLPKNDVGLSNH